MEFKFLEISTIIKFQKQEFQSVFFSLNQSNHSFPQLLILIRTVSQMSDGPHVFNKDLYRKL